MMTEKFDGFKIKKNYVLSGKSTAYQIERLLGHGAFGKVAQCVQLDTKEKLAVKIIRTDASWACRTEATVLKRLGMLNQNRDKFVTLVEDFWHKGHICLAFEMLDMNLNNFVKHYKPLCLSEIRVLTQQLLEALNTLKNISLVHADIKPDNIMLVNHRLQPLKLKLIDFGMSLPVNMLKCGTKVQPLGYRAPEVILGLPLDEAIDMWSLGCILAYMYLGQHLYPTRCQYEVMRVIVQLHGQPDDGLLNSGICTNSFFRKVDDLPAPSWKLNTRNEYQLVTGAVIKPCSGIFNKFTSLDDVAKTRQPLENVAEHEDNGSLLSLLRHMLQVDPKKRIRPLEALGHRYLTMRHFPSDYSDDPYVITAHLTRDACQFEKTVEYEHFITSSEVVSKHEPPTNNGHHPLAADETAAGDAPAAATGPRPTVKAFFKRIRQSFSRVIRCCSVVPAE